MTRREALLALNMVPNLGPVRLRKLVEVLGSPEAVLSARRSDLEQVEGLTQPAVDSILSWESKIDLSGELARVRDFGASVLTRDDEAYPRLLREIHDPVRDFRWDRDGRARCQGLRLFFLWLPERLDGRPCRYRGLVR